jgi:hypothetical protein
VWRAWEKSDVIAAASTACAIAVFLFGRLQHRASENWKRSEFVAAQIKEFNSDKINRGVLLMMDYDPVRVELFPDKAKSTDRYVDVKFSMSREGVHRRRVSDTRYGYILNTSLHH